MMILVRMDMYLLLGGYIICGSYTWTGIWLLWNNPL